MQASSLVSLATLLGLALLVLPSVQLIQAQQARDGLANRPDLGQPEPESGPEPYSFGYSAESVGGMSSHQEQGDGRGHVQGFYTVMGDDGRERRVDYVADENGYRATVSTNEVGTRSESAADAQFEARLPSGGQLEQAKVSAQEYQYLEETHAAERQRHLSQLSSNRQQQQQQLSRFASNSQQWNNQQLDGGARFQFGANNQTYNQQQQFNRFQNQRNLTEFNGNNSSSSNINNNYDADWRQRSLANQQLQQQQGQFANQNSQNSYLSSTSARPSGLASTSGELSINNQQQAASELGVQVDLSTQAYGNSNGNNNFGSSATGSGQFSRFQTSAGSEQQQQQLNQRLNQQQVAPQQRQQAQQAAWQMTTRGALPARTPVTVMQRQLEAQFMQQAFQLTDQDYPRQPSTNQRWSQYNTADQQQANQQQQLRQPQQQPDYSQLNQQQNNILDEVSGEQVEPLQPLVSVNQQQDEFRLTNNTQANQALGLQTGGFVQNQQTFVGQQQQQQQAITTTSAPFVFSTNSSTTPSGFLSINLQKQENSSQTSQNLDQEVDQNNNLRPVTGLVEDFNRVNLQTNQQQQQQGFRPNSIKQIIESQGQQEVITTPAAIVRPETTPTQTITSSFSSVTREPEVFTTANRTSELVSQVYDQTTARPSTSIYLSSSSQAPVRPSYEYSVSTEGYTTGGATYQNNSSQAEQVSDQVQYQTTTRRPTYIVSQPQQQQLQQAGRGQANFFNQQQQQQQRGQYGAVNGTKSAIVDYDRTNSYTTAQQRPATTFGTTTSTQASIASFQPTRLATTTTTTNYPTSQSSYGTTSTLLQQQQPQRTVVEQEARYQTLSGFGGQQAPYRVPQEIATPFTTTQNSLIAPIQTVISGNKQPLQPQTVIETSTSGALTGQSARPVFVAPDRNSELRQQWRQQQQQQQGAVKGGASKASGERKQQFWQSLAARQSAGQAQPLAAYQASVDYANNGNLSGAATLSANSYGSRLTSGRR